ncbi:MAG: hypothetical protein EBW14_13685, partial [Oxalobacteraceae bacterium]|nr:hypothetical protein [Oxalobacteraceae bacterium]
RFRRGSLAHHYHDGIEKGLVIVVERVDDVQTDVIDASTGKQVRVSYPRDDLVPVQEEDVLRE